MPAAGLSPYACLRAIGTYLAEAGTGPADET